MNEVSSNRILGIDPGYAITGWGLIEAKPVLKTTAYGAVTTMSGIPLEERLAVLFLELNEIIDLHSPDCAVVEKLFFSANKTTAEGVYEARGVILLSLALKNIPVMELTPLKIKQCVAGSGRASKADVIRMVRRLLSIENKIKYDDTSDALAGAIAGAFHLSSEKMYRAIKGKL